MRRPSAAQSRAVAAVPAPRDFPVGACPESIARGCECLLLTHISIMGRRQATIARWKPAQVASSMVTEPTIAALTPRSGALVRARENGLSGPLLGTVTAHVT